jgi:membrane-associated phospholipid phosphatase
LGWSAQAEAQVAPATEKNDEHPTAAGLLQPVTWEPHYREVGPVDYSLTVAFGTLSVVSRLVGPGTSGPTGSGAFDESVRDSIRGLGFRRRLVAEDISDVLLGFSSSYALFGDPLVNAAWLRDSPEVGYQIGWINAEVIAVTLGIQQFTANLVGRERPYGRTCGTGILDERTHRCEGGDRYRSFFSGHTSVPFSVAAATCVHHAYLPLSDGHTWVPCTLGFLTAAASGTLRIVSDNHYASDVLTGIAVGTTIGLTIPLLHYATGVSAPTTSFGESTWTLVPNFAYGYGRPQLGFTIMGRLP